MTKFFATVALFVSTASFANVCNLSDYDASSDFKGLNARYKCSAQKSKNHIEDICFFSSSDSVVHRYKTHVHGVDGSGVVRTSANFDLSRYSDVVGNFEIIDNDDLYMIKKIYPEGARNVSKTFSIDKSTLEAVEIKKDQTSTTTTLYSCEEMN